MRVLEALLTLFALLLSALPAFDADAQMIRLDAETHFLLPEVAVVLGPASEEEDEESAGKSSGVHVLQTLPEAARPEAYRSVDLRQGDVLLMANGKRLADVAALRGIHEALETGDELKIAVRRGADRFFVRFPKADEETLAQGGMRIIRRGPGGEGGGPSPAGSGAMRMEIGGGFDRMEPALGLGVILGEGSEARVEVAAVLPIGTTSLKQGDVLLSLSGDAIDSLDAVLAALEAVEDGEALELEVERDGEPLKVEMAKIAAEGAISFRSAP